MAKNDKKTEEKDFLLQRLIKSRTILLSKAVDDKMVESVAGQLFIMQEDDEKSPIFVYINSPGGAADSGFAIFDLLKFVSPKIITICNGICASAAIMIFLGGAKGFRFSLPNSRFLLHQPSTSAQGSASDLQITANEIIKMRQRYNEIVAKETGKTPQTVTTDSSRDFWLSADEAMKYGLVNKVIAENKVLKSEMS